jgi:hypothetical protein
MYNVNPSRLVIGKYPNSSAMIANGGAAFAFDIDGFVLVFRRMQDVNVGSMSDWRIARLDETASVVDVVDVVDATLVVLLLVAEEALGVKAIDVVADSDRAKIR